jgi:hypothetical protein
MASERSNPSLLPAWAEELVTLYESGAYNQFVLYGNVQDRFLLPLGAKAELGSLKDFLLKALLPKFNVILSCDMGSGLRVEKGIDEISNWPSWKDLRPLPRDPVSAVRSIDHYFRYCSNLAKTNRKPLQVGCVLFDVQLMAPVLQGGFNYEIGSLASLVRSWSTETIFTDYLLASFLITENLNDLNPLIGNNPRTARILIPLPSPAQIHGAVSLFKEQYPKALSDYDLKDDKISSGLAGASLNKIESLVKTKEYKKEAISATDLAFLKKLMVESDCNGLIEFLEPKRTLDDLVGADKIKAWLRQDLALWNRNDAPALPKGYLLCGPVGTGKTFMVECLAGEAGVPVVKLKNFRDKWVGSSEGNLEKIFRLLHALERCYVFVDEADQALGKRDAGSGDSGLSGRIYSMLAEEMGRSENRGKIIWILASSRPDLIEVDLKRPGRVDVKIPLFPTTTPEETFNLLQTLFEKRGLAIPSSAADALRDKLPVLVTPGAADALVMKVYRDVRTAQTQPLESLTRALLDYQNPIPREIMEFQIRLAIQEASDRAFVPAALLENFG